MIYWLKFEEIILWRMMKASMSMWTEQNKKRSEMAPFSGTKCFNIYALSIWSNFESIDLRMLFPNSLVSGCLRLKEFWSSQSSGSSLYQQSSRLIWLSILISSSDLEIISLSKVMGSRSISSENSSMSRLSIGLAIFNFT